MKVIGITGTTGSGKSSVCMELKKRGACVIDADEISRMVTKRDGAAFDEIINFFGEEILDDCGEINRGKLADIVFNDPEKLKTLNNITHKHIFCEMKKRLSECFSEIAVLDVPLLFSCDFPIKCDLTVAVIADLDVRMARIIKRDNISRDAAYARAKNQLTDEEYAELADVCFKNNGGLDKIKLFVDELIKAK